MTIPGRSNDRPEGPPPIAVLIVTWNTRDAVVRHLGPLAAAYPVTAVDNASTDGTAGALRARYPAVQVIANPANLGYAAAVNQGMAATAAPYVLVANADVACRPDAVRALAEFLDDHPRAALVGPRLKNPDGSLQLSWGREPALMTEWVQNIWWRRLERAGRLSGFAAAPRRVDWVLGACFLLRRAAWQALHGLDERYFMYFEEVDLCSRARRTGWEIWYDPAAEAVHEGRASTGQIPDAMALAYRRSQLRFYRRFHGVWGERGLRAYFRVKLGGTADGRRLLHALQHSTP